MRSLLLLTLAGLLAATLSGCTGSDSAASDLPTEPTVPAFQDALFEGEPDDGQPTGDAGSHGAPEVQEGGVETGMMPPLQLPSFWARKTVTVANDFGGADLGVVFVGADSGSVTVVPGDGEGYTIEAVIEARGFTEQEARDTLDRIVLEHTDTLEPDGLHLTTVLRHLPQQNPLPLPITIGLGTGWGWGDLVVTLPASAAYELAVDSSSGEVDVSGLRGPLIELTTSYGSITAERLHVGTLAVDSSSGSIELETIQADFLEAATSNGGIEGSELRIGTAIVDSSSGDIELEGTIDTLEADASSGSIDIRAHGRASGVYQVSASSGDVTLEVLSGIGRAYHVKAEASSGEVDVEIEDSDVIDEDDDEVEVISLGFEEAAIQTVIDVSTSSGNIEVSDSSSPPSDDEDDEEDGEHDHDG